MIIRLTNVKSGIDLQNNLFVTVGSDFHNKDGLRPEIGFVNTEFALKDDIIDEIIMNLIK
jgi:hypothetical protein